MIIEKRIALCIEGMNLSEHLTPHDTENFEEVCELACIVFEIPLEKAQEKMRSYSCSLTWLHKLEALYDQSGFTHQQLWGFTKTIQDPIMRMHSILYIICILCKEEKINAVPFYIACLPQIKTFDTECTQYKGYRELLKYYAQKADLNNFNQTLKNCKSQKDRYEIAEAKSTFIGNVSKQYGLEKALNLCGKKLYKGFERQAIRPHLINYTYREMSELIKSHPILSKQPDYFKEETLVLTFVKQAHKLFLVDDFEELYAMIDKINPKVKHGDAKLRDWLFMELGLTCRDINLVVKCRKAIKNNWVKGELKEHEANLNKALQKK